MYSYGGTIKNLILRNVNISGLSNVGAITVMNHGTISNVTVSGNINAISLAGGMVSVNYGLIERSLTTEWVSTKQGGAAGLVYENRGKIIKSRSMSNTYSLFYSAGFVSNNYGEITECEALGHVVANFSSGTFVSLNHQSGTITNYKSFGNLYTYYPEDLFIGWNYGKVVKSYATGKILSYEQQPQW